MDWRNRGGHEVDFVLEQDSELVAIEIKTGAQVTQQDAGGIHGFAARLGRAAKLRRGVVLHSGAPRQLGDNIVALPWGWAFP